VKKNKKQTTINSIPYVNLDVDTGIFYLGNGRFSQTLKFSDINYLIAREDERVDVYTRYSKMLNLFTDEVDVLLQIVNRKADFKDIEKEVTVELKNDDLDEIRKDYNRIIVDGLRDGKGNMKKELYLTLIIQAKNFKEADKELQKIIKEIESEFKTFGSHLEEVSAAQRLELIHDELNYKNVGDFKYEFSQRDNKRGKESKAAIAPDYMKFELNYYMLNERYYRGLYLKSVGETLDDEFINDLLSTNTDMVISLYMKPLEKIKSIEVTRKKKTEAKAEIITRRRKAIKNKSLEAYIPEELEERLEATNDLLEKLKTNGDKFFNTTFVITCSSKDKSELELTTKSLQRIAGKHDVRLNVLINQQEPAFKLSLPLGTLELNTGRYFTTTEAGIFTPFGNQELLQKNGLYYGKNLGSGNSLIIDRRQTVGAGHGAFLGMSGSGKSFFAKNEILNVFMNTDEEVIVIDLLEEFTELTTNLDGTIIELSSDSDMCINPFDLTKNYGGNGKGLKLKSEFLLSFFNKLLGGHAGLGIAEKSILDRCIDLTYRNFIASGYDPNLTPTLKDFQEVLKEQEEKEAKILATALEIYSKGSLSVFSGKTNIDTNNRMVCYNLNKLGEELQEIAYLVIIDNIMQRLSYNAKHNIPSRLYCDEVHMLLNNKTTSDFFIKLFKVARHMHCIVSIMTQEVSNLLENDKIAATISNSSFLVLFNQNSREREKLTKLLQLSETQLGYIKAAKKGTGLLILNETSIIPFSNIISKNTSIYKMISTDLDRSKASKEKEARMEAAITVEG
jgi:type IV secretory pathway VirB4 component